MSFFISSYHLYCHLLIFFPIPSVWGFSRTGPSSRDSLGPCRILHFTSSQKPLLAPLEPSWFYPDTWLDFVRLSVRHELCRWWSWKVNAALPKAVLTSLPFLWKFWRTRMRDQMQRNRRTLLVHYYPTIKGTSQDISVALNILLSIQA